MNNGTINGIKELNVRYYGTADHLAGNLVLLGSVEASNLYKDKMYSAAETTGIDIVYYTILTNHVHKIIGAEEPDQVSEFYRRLNGSFSRSVKYLKKKDGTPLLAAGSKVFADAPFLTPQYGPEQFLFTVCYQYHNSDGHDPFKFTNGEYKRSAAWEYERGIRTPENDTLLKMLGLTWQRLHDELLVLPARERAIKIREIASRQDPRKMDKLFKLDPDKPFTAQLDHMQGKGGIVLLEDEWFEI